MSELISHLELFFSETQEEHRSRTYQLSAALRSVLLSSTANLCHSTASRMLSPSQSQSLDPLSKQQLWKTPFTFSVPSYSAYLWAAAVPAMHATNSEAQQSSENKSSPEPFAKSDLTSNQTCLDLIVSFPTWKKQDVTAHLAKTTSFFPFCVSSSSIQPCHGFWDARQGLFWNSLGCNVRSCWLPALEANSSAPHLTLGSPAFSSLFCSAIHFASGLEGEAIRYALGVG